MELLTHPSILFCEICDIHSISDEQHRFHLLGKRHWSNQRARDEAQRSIYIRGFPVDTQEKDIQDVLSVFGAIHKTIISPKNNFAIVEYTSVDDTLKVLNCTNPIMLRGSPLTVRPRNFKPLVPKKTLKATNDDGASAMVEEKSFEKEEKHSNSLYNKFHLTPENIESIKSRSSLEEQIHSLVSCIQMSPSTHQSYIELLSRLKSHFLSVFPSCQVAPFGSIVTGLATPTSDMDVTLVTEWTEDDSKYLSSEVLISESKDSHSGCHGDTIEDMETSDTHVSHHPLHPIADSITKFSLPPNIKIAGHNMKRCSREYKEALKVIGGVNDFIKILAIPTARCPIIRFTDTVTNITCDVSVNNRFGLYNSKVIKLYITLEPRLIPILLVLRVWINSLPTVRISNYAFTLMVIHCLQRLAQPLLPCLQCQGPWPLNMDWFSTKGFSHEEVMSINVDGWIFQLTDHRTLLPSQNQASVGELLCCFFSYYSSLFIFTTQAITIHTPPDKIITKEVASAVASGNSPPGSNPRFNITPLTVQDPIELVHNVTKTVSIKSLEVLKNAMTTSCVTMETILQSHEESIFSLFENLSSPGQSPSKVVKTHQMLCFSLENIANLSRKISTISELSNVIQRVDVTSKYIRSKLGTVALKSLVDILESDLGFNCVPITKDINNYPALELPSQTPSLIPTTVPPIVPPLQPSSFSVAPQMHPVLPGSVFESVDPLLMKRQRNEKQDEDKESESHIHQKKTKLNKDDEHSVIALLERHCLTSNGAVYPNAVQCSTSINTWMNRRRNRRQRGMVQVTPTSNDPPILQFIMSVVDSYVDGSCKIISIELCVPELEDMTKEFQTFFAYFKKSVII